MLPFSLSLDKEDKKDSGVEKGFLLFENTSEVIRAEELLKKEGFPVKVKAPPPEVRQGCDMVIEIPLMLKLEILRFLEEHRVSPLSLVPVKDPLLEPVDMCRVKDFGDYLMIHVANMKITVDKKTKVIVNISGGGCPDVPFLASIMLGKPLDQAPEPRAFGHTLCGYTLQLALEEAKKRCLPL
ncbi:hypothetical protein TH606_09620 [Thermodesulfatator autotrophicus]|uniref:Uncharacterized protein n=1 Tax=Thermodesulfatator autotrophicus TaxID=1795632 RepID=A0A177E4S3_9BACT|nr:hypothetical protein TH606_09620 [Thermodesulfatator autotrophicus]